GWRFAHAADVPDRERRHHLLSRRASDGGYGGQRISTRSNGANEVNGVIGSKKISPNCFVTSVSFVAPFCDPVCSVHSVLTGARNDPRERYKIARGCRPSISPAPSRSSRSGSSR